MGQDRDARIRERAHAIWLEEGRPDGRDAEHWRLATEAIAEEDAATSPLMDAAAEPVPLVPPNR